MTDEWLKSQLASDSHAPHATRVKIVLANIDSWYEAFCIGPGHALYLPPEKRVRLW